MKTADAADSARHAGWPRRWPNNFTVIDAEAAQLSEMKGMMTKTAALLNVTEKHPT
jgi:hypothetical protein